MIENELQYKLTKKQASNFRDAIEKLNNSTEAIHPLLKEIHLESLQGMLDELTEQIEEYERKMIMSLEVMAAYSQDVSGRKSFLHLCFLQAERIYAILEIEEHAGGEDAVCEINYYPLVSKLDQDKIPYDDAPTKRPDALLQGFFWDDFWINNEPMMCLENEFGGSGYRNLPDAIHRLQQFKEK